MNLQRLEELPPPPGIIGSLRTGFEAVSSHVILILLPALVDIFLWLGPRFSVEGLFNPFLSLIFSQAQQAQASSTDLQQIADFQSMFGEMLKHFNLLSLFSRLDTFPVGISSLLAQTMPTATPFGAQQVVEISSLPGLVMLTFLFVVAGWVVGGLYFLWVSGTALGNTNSAMRITAPWAILQTLILSAVWMIALTMVFIPVVFVLAILRLLSPVLASAAFFVMLLLALWLIVPLFFTPHGIFVRKQNAFYSIFTSLRMARFTLPTSALFVLSVFLLSSGLNYLWRVP